MSNAALQPLQIQADTADPGLAQQQGRFNALVQDVAQWRAALAQWKERITRYRQATDPVRRELHAAWRQWVFALDHASLQPGLSRAEREQLTRMLREAATALIALEDDAEIAAVLSRHEEGAPSVQPRQEDAGETTDETGLEDRAQDWEQQAASAAARREERAARRRAATVSKRRTQAAQEVSQSLRDVYRRLASALHPDREPDEQQRKLKTALMQQANQAYAAGNLLALLELQLEAEQIDAVHAAAADQRRLQHYVAVLQEQLTDLQSESRRLEAEFRAAAGVAPGGGAASAQGRSDRLLGRSEVTARGSARASPDEGFAGRGCHEALAAGRAQGLDAARARATRTHRGGCFWPKAAVDGLSVRTSVEIRAMPCAFFSRATARAMLEI